MNNNWVDIGGEISDIWTNQDYILKYNKYYLKYPKWVLYIKDITSAHPLLIHNDDGIKFIQVRVIKDFGENIHSTVWKMSYNSELKKELTKIIRNHKINKILNKKL